jgi:polyisoprenoid-binding protein YceI
MRRFFALGLLVAGLLPAQVATWEIDPAHSSSRFSVRHMVLSDVPGDFANTRGTVQWDPKDPAKTVIDVTIDTATINTKNPKRDAHLRSADFFEAEKYPTITFKSTKAERGGDGKLRVMGDLTMHGVTKPVTLAVEGPTPEVNTQGKVRMSASATTRVNRKDFGLLWNKALETGGLVLADEVSITLTVELVKKL